MVLPPKHQRLAGPSFRRFILHVSFALMGWLFLVFLDPLGTYSFGSTKSTKLFSQIFSPFYGVRKPRAQNSITIILITKKDLKNTYKHFPLSIEEYGEIISQILADDPRGLFVDIDFQTLGQHEEDAPEKLVRQLADTGWTIPSKPVPLIFGMGDAAHDQPISLPEDLVNTTANRFKVGHAMTVLDKDPSLYPLHEKDSLHPAHDTAALALYRAICDGPGCPIAKPLMFRHSLVLQWGLRPAPLISRQNVCQHSGDHWLTRFAYAGWWLAHGALPGLFPNEIVQICPYTNTLEIGDLNEHPNDAANIIRNRVVLLGIQSDQDVADTPLNGLLQGIFLHAMALDNLMTYGNRYFCDPGKWLGFIPEYKLLTAAIWLFLSVLVSAQVVWPYHVHYVAAWLRTPIRLMFWDHMIRIRNRRLVKQHIGYRLSRFLDGSVADRGLLSQLMILTVKPINDICKSILLITFLMILDWDWPRWRFSDLLILGVLYPLLKGLSLRTDPMIKRLTGKTS